MSQERHQQVAELKVVLVSNGRTTQWRLRCAACGTVADFDSKAAAARAATIHADQTHDGDSLVVVPR